MRADNQKTSRLRLILVAVVFTALLIGVRASGLVEAFDAQAVRKQVEAAGIWGILLYLAVFAGGELIHIPGMVFVAAGILAYGRAWGFGVAYLGALVSVSFSFLVVRLIGGQALHAIEQPLIQRILARLEERPIGAVIVLRLFLWLAPALNYTLALTKIGFRDYLIGSAIGLLPILIAAAIFFDWMFTYLL